MVQSADTIEHFPMERFDRNWKKFLERRQAMELHSTIDRRNLRRKNER